MDYKRDQHITTLVPDAEVLRASNILRVNVESMVAGKRIYYCYLPDFAILMHSYESATHAEKLCFKLMAYNLTKLSGDNTQFSWYKRFPTLVVNVVDGKLTIKPNKEKVEELLNNFMGTVHSSQEQYEVNQA